MRYGLTALAAASDYLVENASVLKALETRQMLMEGCTLIAESPGVGSRRPDWTRHPVRFWLVGRYWLVYRSETVPVEIVRVVHAARNIPKVLRRF